MSTQKRKKSSLLEIKEFENKKLSLKNQVEFLKQLLRQKNSECSRLIALNQTYKDELEKYKKLEKKDYLQQIIELKKIVSRFEEKINQLKKENEFFNKLHMDQNEIISKLKTENLQFENDISVLLRDIEKLLEEKDNKILELTNYTEHLLSAELKEDENSKQIESIEEKADIKLDRTIMIKKWIYEHKKIKYLVQILWTNRRRQSTS